jgi:hypothetical protein
MGGRLGRKRLWKNLIKLKIKPEGSPGDIFR